MDLNIELGTNELQEICSVDLEKSNIGLVLLAGSAGTGKSIFANHIYRQLIEKNSPEEINFLIVDNIRVEFASWDRNSKYLYCPVVWGIQALNILESLAARLDEVQKEKKHYLIHIEECDLFYTDSKRNEKVFKRLLEHRQNRKIHIGLYPILCKGCLQSNG